MWQDGHEDGHGLPLLLPHLFDTLSDDLQSRSSQFSGHFDRAQVAHYNLVFKRGHALSVSTVNEHRVGVTASRGTIVVDGRCIVWQTVIEHRCRAWSRIIVMVLSAGVLVVNVWSAGGHQQFVVVGVGQVDLLCSLLWSWSESWKEDRVVVCGMIRDVLAIITFQFISGVFGTHPVSYFRATTARRVTRFIV